MKANRRFLLVALTSALLATACSAPDSTADLGDTRKLARTLGIITGSSAAHPKVLRVLFYGQSITASGWDSLAMAALRGRYPDTVFVATNKAVGGFASDKLVRLVERDITAEYPDLVVFHVYGDHRAYREIIRTIRAKTAAEVILQTDHLAAPAEPRCPSGIRLTFTPPPGCKGFLWYSQRDWSDHMTYDVIPGVARDYGAAIEPQRAWWTSYVRERRIAPTQLLADEIHPNAAGKQLMAAMFVSYVERLVVGYRGEPQDLVTAHPPPAAAAGRPIALDFVGNRVEIVARAPLDGRIGGTVDGRSLDAIAGCYQVSRSSTLANMTDWPAIKRLTMAVADRRAERWQAVLSGFNADQSDFDFTVTGSVTGADGQGRASRDFTSASGRVRIAAQDWETRRAFAVSGQPLAEGTRIDWSVDFACRDYLSVALPDGRREWRHLLATGLANGPHRLTLTSDADASATILEIRSYRPALDRD